MVKACEKVSSPNIRRTIELCYVNSAESWRNRSFINPALENWFVNIIVTVKLCSCWWFCVSQVSVSGSSEAQTFLSTQTHLLQNHRVNIYLSYHCQHLKIPLVQTVCFMNVCLSVFNVYSPPALQGWQESVSKSNLFWFLLRTVGVGYYWEIPSIPEFSI